MTRFSRFATLSLLLIVAACSSDKYPYPHQFVSSDAVCPCALGSPYADGSPEQQAEIASILKRQKTLSFAAKRAILEEDHITPAMMVTPVLGQRYSEATHPELFSFMRRGASDAWRIADETQDYWARRRPWLADDRVQLLVSRITRPSYPSGHTVTNHVWAHMLSELFPQKRAALFARAFEIGMHRVDAGVHYPSDVNAGRQLAAIIYEKMRKDAGFKQALASAKAELRAASGAAKLPLGKAPTPPCSRAKDDMAACL
jgi:acid phosphatase (class A)